MAASSLLTLIDDIASLLDDVAAMTKVAATKTAGVLGDDLALNAQQVAGVKADRELPVVWAVAKGSLRNKAILVPAALAISALAPWAITPLLMLGGAYLCYEGFEKLAHSFMHAPDKADTQHAPEPASQSASQSKSDPDGASVDVAAYERDKIKGAIRTDFVLSAEIITITLGTVAEATFTEQVIVLIGIAVIMTVGVYGFVAGIVKIDDAGLWMSRKPGALARSVGRGLLAFAPLLMKTLSVVGTAAMFMVGGGILTHGLAPLHHLIEMLVEEVSSIGTIGGLLASVLPVLLNAAIGVMTGALALLVVTLAGKLRTRSSHA